MRISDWSSDVCSSDLRQLELGESGARAGADQAARGQRRVRLVDLVAVAAFEQPDVDALLRDRIEKIGEHDARRATRAEQIGRASCRERVCQYVSICVVAVSLKKKHKTKENITR